jgi:excisionase family DNA binding protein
MLDEQRASSEPSEDANAIQDDGRLTYTLTEAAFRLGISRALAYEAAQRGELPVCRIGRRVLVPRLALLRLLGQDDLSGSKST